MTSRFCVSILVPSLRGGGAEKNLLYLAKELTDQGYQVDLLLISQSGLYHERIPEDVNLITLDSDRAITVLPELMKYIWRNEPDTLLTSLSVPNVVAILSKVIMFSGTRVIVRVSNVHSEKDREGLKYRILPLLIRFTYPLADVVVAISEDVKKDLIQNFGVSDSKISLINNPSFSQEIVDGRTEPPEHPELFEGEKPIILSAGRLSEQKDFATLIRAFNESLETVNAKLIILGEGEKQAELKMLVEDLGITNSVFFPGFVSNPYSYMYRADVFVLSSLFEGFPNVVVEALGCRCPVIATDAPGGSSEILANGKYGKLVPPNNPEALSDAIDQLLVGDIQYDKDELEARAMDFSPEKIMIQYLELLSGIE